MSPACLPPGDRRTDARASSAPALQAKHVGVRYAGADAPALVDVDVNVPAGARVALVGPNGSGKSTLLKAAVGLVPLAGGAIELFGGPLAACRRRVAYLPQRGELDWRFPISVRRLVLSGRYVHLGWLRRPGR
jgi:ABC-type Mn2+/Zn2+ transport system ATPase subunit